MKNMLESKKFSLILGGLLLLFLGISGFVLLGDSSNNVEEVAQAPDNTKEDAFENPPFTIEEPVESPEYEEEISKQYEEYQRIQEEKKKENPKKPVASPSKDSKDTAGNGNVGGTIGGGNGSGGSGSGGSGSGSGGGSGSGNGDNGNKGGITLPPINIGNPNPTVPKLPQEPPQPTVPPVKPPGEDKPPVKPPGEDKPPVKPPGEDKPPVKPPGEDKPPVKPPGEEPPPDEEPPGENPPTKPGGDGDFGSIVPIDRPAPVDTAPHNPPTENQESGKTGLSTISTNYGNGFGIVPVKFQSSKVGATAQFEFYNGSDKPMTLTNDNIGFAYDRGVGDLADSNLGGSPVVIQPKSTTTLYVSTSYHEARSLFFKFNGTDSVFDFSSNEPNITDTKPLTSDDIFIKDGTYVESLSVGHISGNENLKVEPLGVVLASNNQIGPLKKSEKGALGLVKVRVANTSNKEITIQELIAGSWDFEANQPNAVTFPLKDLSLLGGNALATKIPPKTIVDGYLPFYLKDTNHVSMVHVKTSDIDFQLTAIESYGLIFE